MSVTLLTNTSHELDANENQGEATTADLTMKQSNQQTLIKDESTLEDAAAKHQPADVISESHFNYLSLSNHVKRKDSQT